MKKSTPEVLDRFKVSDPTTLFISPRDHQPYVISYGGTGAPQIIAHEQTGVDGKRWTVAVTGVAKEMDDTEFQEAMSVQR
ncbi:MAG: hypothetical protein O2931_01010 [Planctomycetota bacterium]|nr:hypothetical protein [Planctomycetota bacterium]MDA1177352.1 hypothetical protein [Planctomycetota bacterium]